MMSFSIVRLLKKIYTFSEIYTVLVRHHEINRPSSYCSSTGWMQTSVSAALPPLEWSQIIESMPPRPRCLGGSLYGDGCHFLVRSLGIRPNNPQPLPDCAQTLLQPLPEAVPVVVGDFL